MLGIGLIGLVMMASTTVAGPVPTWDDQINNQTRFRVLNEFNGEAVLDRETGLVWEKSPSTDAFDWSQTRFNCLTRNTGGRRGWRLPSIHELLSLVDPSAPLPGPMLPPGHPFLNVQTAPGRYWSATTVADGAIAAWDMSFGGGVDSTLKAFNALGWCVRGGGPLSEY
jgi:hypothetical protein